MDTRLAYAKCLRAQAEGRPLMVFDWVKAARLIRARQPKSASAGLCADWEWTGGTIYANGKPDTEDYTYLASCHATPELEMDGEVSDCFRLQSESPGWDAKTKWPDEALAVLEGRERAP